MEIISPKSCEKWNNYFKKVLTENRPRFKDTQDGNPKTVEQGS